MILSPVSAPRTEHASRARWRGRGEGGQEAEKAEEGRDRKGLSKAAISPNIWAEKVSDGIFSSSRTRSEAALGNGGLCTMTALPKSLVWYSDGMRILFIRAPPLSPLSTWPKVAPYVKLSTPLRSAYPRTNAKIFL